MYEPKRLPRYQSILVEIDDKVKYYVVNQSRYNPSGKLFSVHCDAMYTFADSMTDEVTLKFLEGKLILHFKRLLNLAGKIGIENLYNEDAWIDCVSEYIYKNRKSCAKLWQHIFDNKGKVKETHDRNISVSNTQKLC